MPDREYTQQEKDDLKVMRDLEHLLEQKKWKTYTKLLDSKKVKWHTTILKPVDNMGQLFVEEYAKGAVYGLTQATDLPAIIIQGVKESVLPPKSGQE